MEKLNYLDVCKHFNHEDAPEYVFINENKHDHSFSLRNSFCPGANVVIIDHQSHLNDAYDLLSQPLIDDRFPRTYGERSEKAAMWDYESIVSTELIIDFRTNPAQSINKNVTKQLEAVPVLDQTPIVNAESVTQEQESVTFENVTPKLESVTQEQKSVTSNILCPCGCEKTLFGRKKYFSASCRKRMQRKRDTENATNLI